MNTLSLNKELQRISGEVRAVLRDPANRPNFAPAQLLEAVLAYPMTGGKAMRPALLTYSCCALGGDARVALHAGVAVELYHTYTLVHDDVIDRDLMRRGQPSVHALMESVGRHRFNLGDDAMHYGVSMAILAGDCHQSWAIDLLATLPDLGVNPKVALQLIRRLQGVVGPAIVEGEARDIELPFISVEQVSHETILRVILTKTSALFGYCGWAGGMLARGEEDEQVRALAAFAERAGISFQLQDDVLGLIGDEQQLGKPVGSDLREGKRTMIIAFAWERANEAERALLSTVLGNENATPEAITAATNLLCRLGAVEDVQKMARTYLDEALNHLATLPNNPSTALLREIALRMVKREK
ncbi:MAG: polyprenyl synthetase family protein [Armatimonadota bacterium]